MRTIIDAVTGEVTFDYDWEPPLPPPPLVPDEVSKLGLVRAMREVDIAGVPVGESAGPSAWIVVQAALAAAPVEVQEDFAMATRIPRNDPVLLALAEEPLSVPSAVIDAVFIRAVEL